LTWSFANGPEEGANPLFVLRNTLCEVIAQFAGGVTALQLKATLPDEAAVAVSPIGAVGDIVHEEPLPSAN
jgi:hypothetical protein